MRLLHWWNWITQNDPRRMAGPNMVPSVSPWHHSLQFQDGPKPSNLSPLSAQFVHLTEVTVGWSLSRGWKCNGVCVCVYCVYVVVNRGSWQLGVPEALTASSKLMLTHSCSVNTYITHTHARTHTDAGSIRLERVHYSLICIQLHKHRQSHQHETRDGNWYMSSRDVFVCL